MEYESATITTNLYMDYVKNKYTFFFLLFSFITNDSFGQISYPDSCLSVGFYYQKEKGKLDTAKTIKLKATEVAHFFSSNDSLLNIVVVFKNNCNQKITIPLKIRLDMPGQDEFSIEGLRITGQQPDTLEFNMEYDYLPSASGEFILNANKVKLKKYYFPLGFRVNTKGTFKFRLRFFNQYNYTPVNEWKYYYSNWIYLRIK
jgi:hypothetical protein